MLDMTNRKHVNTVLCAILSTMNEISDGEAPEGIIFAVLADKITADDWKGLRDILIAGKLCEAASNHVLRITAKGRELAKKADDFAAKVKAAKK